MANDNAKIILIQEEPRGPSQLIEVSVPADAVGQSKVVLPYIDNLSNTTEQTVIIKALRVIPVTVLANAPTLGAANAPLTELVKMSLTLYSEGWEKGQLIPILTLVDTFTEASGIPWKNRTAQFANWKNVDWNKSFITYSNGSAVVGAPYSVIFEVEYIKINKNGEEIIGPQ